MVKCACASGGAAVRRLLDKFAVLTLSSCINATLLRNPLQFCAMKRQTTRERCDIVGFAVAVKKKKTKESRKLNYVEPDERAREVNG